MYLEDSLTNTFTRLDEANTFYKVTMPDAINDIGRFYLHTSKTTLSTGALLLDSISIYKADATTLRIVGLDSGQTTVTLFNTIGKQTLQTSFEPDGVKDISVLKLVAGVYIVSIQTVAGHLFKKIILE